MWAIEVPDETVEAAKQPALDEAVRLGGIAAYPARRRKPGDFERAVRAAFGFRRPRRCLAGLADDASMAVYRLRHPATGRWSFSSARDLTS